MVPSLSKRQLYILNFLSQQNLSRSEIEEKVSTTYAASKATIVRDLAELIELNFIQQQGAGPSTFYKVIKLPDNLPIFDLDEYFSIDTDKRNILGERFNKDLINKISDFLSVEEIKELEEIEASFAKRITTKGDIELKKELERFVIELSWKSSKIEGNTYTLLDTENLIKNNIEAPNHTQQEKQMILNHKCAFDYILKNPSDFLEFSVRGLQYIHDLILKDMDISVGFRSHKVGISGTKYVPLGNKFQIEEAISTLEKKVRSVKSPFIKALGVLIFVSYIQPFADGNKRTARMVSNAILLANNYHPLSYRSVDEVYYKKALIIFYEQFNYFYFKEVFKEQYEFSAKNYFM